MVNEIGSEFQAFPKENGKGLTFPVHGTLVFSGRTAIEMVLSEVHMANSVLIPSYCCNSMIQPFKKAGLNIEFYAVDNISIIQNKIDTKADILLWCNYFGYRQQMPEFEGVIIEDITHSLLSNSQFHSRSNYLVASLRKWEPIISGGYCSVNYICQDPPTEYCEVKKRAMELKADYLHNHNQERKEEYLTLFQHSNKWLAEHYSGLSIDTWSREYLNHVDVDTQRKIRRRNGHILYEGLGNKVQFLFPETDMDCPLFIPILLPNQRDRIRQILIENEIYCPVHWPRPEGCESNLYDMELSLICDQRYNENDMDRIISVLSKAL